MSRTDEPLRHEHDHLALAHGLSAWTSLDMAQMLTAFRNCMYTAWLHICLTSSAVTSNFASGKNEDAKRETAQPSHGTFG